MVQLYHRIVKIIDNAILVHEPSEKSVPSEGTSENLLIIEGIHVDITKMHDGLSKRTA